MVKRECAEDLHALLLAVTPEAFAQRLRAFHQAQLTGQLTLVLHWHEGRIKRYEVHEMQGGKFDAE